MALTIPPYAWYRGIAAIWEEPEWKKDWDEKAQVVGILLQGASATLSPADRIDFIKMQSRAKKWIGNLPRTQRARLYVESEAFCDALNQLEQNGIDDLAAIIKGHAVDLRFRGIDDPSVTAYSVRFHSERGFAAAWDRVAQGAAANQRMAAEQFGKAHEEAIRDPGAAKARWVAFDDAADARVRRAATELNDADVNTRRVLHDLFEYQK